MADTNAPTAKAPWHLWVVGVLSLLWNAMGALDFAMTETRNATYLKGFTPEQVAYFSGFPLWVVLAWGVATWGSVAGSLLLLARRRWAYPFFLASFVGMILTFTHNCLLTDGLKVMGGSTGSIVFTAAIVLVSGLLLVYARVLHARGVLR